MSWQPLHMQRAEEVLREARHHLDLWLEVADARAPVSSRLPRLRGLLSQVDCALVLTHADLADARAVSAWRRVLPAPCFAVNARTDLPPAIRQFLRERTKRPPLRLFVAGLPNVGKSTLINRLVGGRSAPVGAKAGVTRTEQWVRRGDLALLDLPGILPRKPAIFAAVLGLVPEGQFPVEETALAALRAEKPGRRLFTNVEFYSAVVLEAIGLTKDLFTPTFAVARTVGWTAHALEQAKDNRLIRPDIEYTGGLAGAWPLPRGWDAPG